jgi:fatty-acyl-CoA synthase
MNAHRKVESTASSITYGPPLAEESGIGALTLAGFIREVTERFGPHEAAVIHHEDGGVVRWTYTELWDNSVAVARALLASGVGKGTRVGVLMTNRPEFLCSVFGAALAGCVATCLSTFSTAAELEVLLSKSACSIILLERHVLKKDFVKLLAELEPQLLSAQPGQIRSLQFPFLRQVVTADSDENAGAVEGWKDFLARGNSVSPELVAAAAAAVSPSDAGVLFFSSGSTGMPKGILSSNRGVCLQLWRWPHIYQVENDVRCWSSNGFFFSGNFAMALGATLPSGGSLILQRYFNAAEALPLIEKERATMLLAWPHQWAQLVAEPHFSEVDLSAIKYVDAMTPLAQHPTFRTTWRGPDQAYGNTETFTISSIFPANTPPEIHGGSHGRPLAGNIFKIVDPFTADTLPRNERGEIAVKGPTLMMGYVGTPMDDTLDGEGFFRTGDGGYIDDSGRLFWEGRLNDVIKTGGANVSPLEVDEVLRTCPGVKLTQTVGVPDALLGELVVGCIVPHEGASLTEASIQSFAKQRLASYKVPRRVLFLAEDDLKTTGSAKIKTADLRELAKKRLGA